MTAERDPQPAQSHDTFQALRDAGCTEALYYSPNDGGVYTIGQPGRSVRLWLREGRVHWRWRPPWDGGGSADTVADAWAALSAHMPDRALEAALALVRARGYTVTAPGGAS